MLNHQLLKQCAKKAFQCGLFPAGGAEGCEASYEDEAGAHLAGKVPADGDVLLVRPASHLENGQAASGVEVLDAGGLAGGAPVRERNELLLEGNFVHEKGQPAVQLLGVIELLRIS